MKAKEVEIFYGNKRLKLGKRELDQVIAVVSRKLRNSFFAVIESSDIISVYVDGLKSEFYSNLSEPIIHAIENNYFETKKEQECVFSLLR